jgi:hypothetical protein
MIESQTGSADQTEFVEFVRAGETVAGEFQCVACGHAVMHRGELPACQGCGSALWERSSWTPFARVLSALGDRLQ